MSQTVNLGKRMEDQSASLITRACDMCRKKKIRCKPTSETCEQCIKYKTRCHFTPISVKRKPRRPAGGKRVEKLEKRLEWMEKQLKHAVANQQPETQTSSRHDHRRMETTVLDQFQTGTSHLIQNTELDDLLDPALTMAETSPQVAAFGLPFQTNTDITDLSWWACLNVVLALTHRFRSTPTQDKEEDRESLGYFQNAFAVSNQLTTMHSTLSSVQALLGMSIVIIGTPNHGPASLLLALAIKLAQRMGLHKRDQQPGLNSADIEQRKRVFWTAYILDKDLSLRAGLPPSQDEDNMDVELPSRTPGSPNRPGELDSVDIFNFRARLAMIQGQIYKRLCSMRAARQSVIERVTAVKELEAMLQAWRASVLVNVVPYNHSSILQWTNDGVLLPSIILQLGYFKSLTTIYSFLPVHPKYFEIPASEDPAATQVLSTSRTYSTEARKALKLVQVTPKRHFACVWAVLHIFVSATTALLTHIISNPSNPIAPSDLKLVEPMLTLLCILANSSKNDEVVEMNRSCAVLFERARMAVESHGQAGMSWDQSMTSGQSRQRESVEDFLKRMEKIRSGYDDEDLNSITRVVSPEFVTGDDL
ncbi:hypothetical protein G7Y89_g12031 [Cudoniella acicularis]|uniref:Zn(2)-C6 fungal-type domain-containing protein n=1 Tax=Cudoniella acicularis TaxID=354080 RepID=A0A8H4W022_9HELO|nr:hypothetical protein G7Y89_g12031 [Cudoniella acicularis]